MICTAVSIHPATGIQPMFADFQLSFANLGTRGIFLHNIMITAYMQPDYSGMGSWESEIRSGQLPQVLKAGEMCSVIIRSKWTLDILVIAAKAAESRGSKETALFFSVAASAWNPKGKRLRGEKQLAQLTFQSDGTGWSFGAASDKVFRLMKDRNHNPAFGVSK
jgi:hypothetical protein